MHSTPRYYAAASRHGKATPVRATTTTRATPTSGNRAMRPRYSCSTRHSQRNTAAATRGPRPPRRPGRAPERRRLVRRRPPAASAAPRRAAADSSSRAAAARPAGETVQREHQTADEQQHHEQGIDRRERPDGAQAPGEGHPDPREGRDAEQQQPGGRHETGGASRSPAQRGAHCRQDHHLHGDDREHRQRLGGHELPAAQRRGAEPLEHEVGALEAGRDGQAHHRRPHDRGREHARQEEADGRRARGHRQDRHDREEHEQRHGDAEGDEQVLAVAQQQPQLQPGLRADPPCTREPTDRGRGPSAPTGRGVARRLRRGLGDLRATRRPGACTPPVRRR